MKLINFNLNGVIVQTRSGVEYAETSDGGVELDVVFFSDERNRNRFFFQLTQLLKWKNKLETLLGNRSHDGNYYGINQLYIKKGSLKLVYEDGVSKIRATLVAKAEDLIEDKDKMTGVSIELSADANDVFEFADGNGFYAVNIEWRGYAILFGQMAGNGDTGITDMREFTEGDDSPPDQNNQDMNFKNKEELKTFLEANPEQNALFAELLSDYNTASKETYKADSGKTIEVESEYKQTVKDITEDLAMIKADMAEIKSKFDDSSSDASVQDSPADNATTPEDGADENELTDEEIKIQNSINKARKNEKTLLTNAKFEQVTDPISTEKTTNYSLLDAIFFA